MFFRNKVKKDKIDKVCFLVNCKGICKGNCKGNCKGIVSLVLDRHRWEGFVFVSSFQHVPPLLIFSGRGFEISPFFVLAFRALGF